MEEEEVVESSVSIESDQFELLEFYSVDAQGEKQKKTRKVKIIDNAEIDLALFSKTKSED